MSLIDDIAQWVTTDYLNRPDLLTVARTAAADIYRLVCAKVPFDELMVTSPEIALVANQDTYIIGTDFVFSPQLLAIGDIRITFDSSNKRRLRRSNARVYDALSISPASRPATYSRYDTTIIVNPPPDSSTYTLRFRYRSRPTLQSYTVTGVTWAGGLATATIGAHNIVVGDTPSVSGVVPNGYNVRGNTASAVTAVAATTITYPVATNPGAYISGGTVAAEWLTTILTPKEWDELLKWESLYRVYHYIDRIDLAMALVQPNPYPMQPGAPRKQVMYQTGIIPRLWNDLLSTASSKENVDEDFNINPTIRPYSVR